MSLSLPVPGKQQCGFRVLSVKVDWVIIVLGSMIIDSPESSQVGKEIKKKTVMCY